VPGTYNLGSIEGKIRITYDPSGSQQAKKDTDDVKSNLDKTGKAANEVGNASLLAGGAIAAGLGLAVKSASDFEKTLSAVKAVSGATTDQMEKVRAKAMQIGQDTSFSSGEAAQAMEELVKAGVSVEDVMNGAADATVALAAAGGVDLPTAAGIASAAMNNFNLSAKDMPHIADLIAGAANASAIDVTDFGYSLQQAGAISHLVGLSFDDLSLAITAMGNAGIKGSDAGTSLKTFLSNLQPQTKKQTTLMSDLGLITKQGGNAFFDAAGHVKSLTDISGLLQNALKNQTDQQKQATLETLFGSDAIRAAAVITNEGAAGFQELSKQITGISAADVAKTRLDNFAGTMESLKGTLENTAISIGSILIPVLRSLATMFNGLANTFNGIPKPLQAVLTWFLAISAVLLLVNGAILKLVAGGIRLISSIATVASAVASGMKVIGAALAANPWILIVAAIIAAIALIIIYWDDIVAFLKKIWGFIADLAKSIWGGITDFFSSIWDAVTGAVQAAWNAIVTFLTTIWNWIVANVWPILSPIVNIIKGIFDVLFAIVTGILNVLAAIIEGIWHVIAIAAEAVWNAILVTLTAVWNAILAAFHFVFDPLIDLFNLIWTAISTAAGIVWDAITSAISTAWQAIGRFFVNIWNDIKQTFVDAWNAIPASVKSGIGDVIGKIGEFISWLGRLPGQALNWLVDVGVNILKGMYNGILDGLNWVKNKIISAFESIVKGIKDFFGISSPSKLFEEFGGFTMKGFVIGVEKMQDNVATAMQTVLDPNLTLQAAQQIGLVAATQGLGLATPGVMASSLSGGGSTTSSSSTHIENMTLNVAGNLDPTNPTGFRQTIVNIKDAIRQVERDNA
jgi:TP901 family phage tail tape measure protein